MEMMPRRSPSPTLVEVVAAWQGTPAGRGISLRGRTYGKLVSGANDDAAAQSRNAAAPEKLWAFEWLSLSVCT
jgi:hypothetical protein